VLDDLYWVQGEPARAAAAYLAGRLEAEQHAKTGEAAHNQPLRALTVAFYDPHQADDEIDLANSSSQASTCGPPLSKQPSPPSSATPATLPSKTVSAPCTPNSTSRASPP
jgi:hypothetical protein